MTSNSRAYKIGYWLSLGRIMGTILHFGKDSERISIPISKKGKRHTRERLSDTICHESVHCVRSHIDRFRDRFRYHDVEEAVVYSVENPQNTKFFLRVFPAMLKISSLFPLFVGYYAFVPNPSVIPLLPLAIPAYYGNKTANFFRRCEDEELNPHYLFLRSNPSEYSRRKSIREQLNESEDIRFRIMSSRLGVN